MSTTPCIEMEDAASEDRHDIRLGVYNNNNNNMRCCFDPYSVLGVSRNASLADIKRAYHQQSLLCHPDKVQGGHVAKAQAHDEFYLVRAAYEVLTSTRPQGQQDQLQAHTLYGPAGVCHSPYNDVVSRHYFFTTQPPTTGHTMEDGTMFNNTCWTVHPDNTLPTFSGNIAGYLTNGSEWTEPCVPAVTPPPHVEDDTRKHTLVSDLGGGPMYKRPRLEDRNSELLTPERRPTLGASNDYSSVQPMFSLKRTVSNDEMKGSNFYYPDCKRQRVACA